MFALISNCSNAPVDTGHCTKRGCGRDGELGKKEKKSELCVAGENLLELERTKGGEGEGSGCGGARIATETLKMANDFYNLHLIKSKSARIMYNVPRAVREELSLRPKIAAALSASNHYR